MQRYPFLDVFQENPDGTLNTRRPINVSGVGFGSDVKIGPGVAIGGIDFHKFKYRPIAAEDRNGTLIIRGFFQE